MIGAGGEGGAASAAGAISSTGEAGIGATFFADTEADFATTLCFALTGLIDSLLRLFSGPAEGIELTSDLVSGLSGVVTGLSFAVAGSDEAAGTVEAGLELAVSTFAALYFG